MGVRVEIEVDDPVSGRLEELAGELPERRREMVDDAMRETLTNVVRLNPVDTGRSRAAWVRSLMQMGGAPPDGWQGPQPEAGAITEGAGLGNVQRADEESVTDVRASNAVEYVPFLEFGTSRMAAVAMVRRSLALMRQRVEMLFRLLR